MTDQTQTHENTNPGTSETSLKGSVKRNQNSAQTNWDRAEKNMETQDTLTRKVMIAKNAGHEYVETTWDVVNFFNPNGLGGAKYFIMNGIMVFPYGEYEKFNHEQGIQLDQVMHTDESYFEGRT